MYKENKRFDYKVRFRWKRIIRFVMMVIFSGLLISGGGMFFLTLKNRDGNERRILRQLWETGAYREVFDLSGTELEKHPLDYFFLTTHGFAAYQLALAQINNNDTRTYVDACIWSLRKALLIREGAKDGGIRYVLGKAYYAKGSGYADLAVKFLEEARELSYTAWDIPEYLGLAYAGIHDYRRSVAAFTLALNPPELSGEGSEISGEGSPGDGPDYPQDLLLLTIARSYLELEEWDAAKAYLWRCVETSRDAERIVTARLLLGEVLANSNDRAGAEAQYLKILEEAGENAEAHYRLGELYAAGGDTTKARFEWRTALRIDPTHRQSRLRLNI
ncbi:MAG: tetratricopeptide repeat protein [Spirochaetaceae bacterium]|jgi:tetratricopeptide (TPR) repeat protein|nr:tetratricopeptide repeat protein [Spirochaetaceae bacterium]